MMPSISAANHKAASDKATCAPLRARPAVARLVETRHPTSALPHSFRIPIWLISLGLRPKWKRPATTRTSMTLEADSQTAIKSESPTTRWAASKATCSAARNPIQRFFSTPRTSARTTASTGRIAAIRPPSRVRSNAAVAKRNSESVRAINCIAVLAALPFGNRLSIFSRKMPIACLKDPLLNPDIKCDRRKREFPIAYAGSRNSREFAEHCSQSRHPIPTPYGWNSRNHSRVGKSA